ncbi:hypothetical protein GW915_12680 [bacterium]|nr:hypothetical protein [bacterium]
MKTTLSKHILSTFSFALVLLFSNPKAEARPKVPGQSSSKKSSNGGVNLFKALKSNSHNSNNSNSRASNSNSRGSSREAPADNIGKFFQEVFSSNQSGGNTSSNTAKKKTGNKLFGKASPFSSDRASLSMAMKYDDYRYIWGSYSPSNGGFDCSGLVSYVLMKQGCISQRYTTSGFYGVLKRATNCEPGDIILGSRHVGFYAGDGRVFAARGRKSGIGFQSSSFGRCYENPC